jgi:hypothetical protein
MNLFEPGFEVFKVLWNRKVVLKLTLNCSISLKMRGWGALHPTLPFKIPKTFPLYGVTLYGITRLSSGA